MFVALASKVLEFLINVTFYILQILKIIILPCMVETQLPLE
jgi:hypothetical protein